jgi:hypothetical protein
MHHQPCWGLGRNKEVNSSRLLRDKLQKPFFICSYLCGRTHHHFSLLINIPLRQ